MLERRLHWIRLHMPRVKRALANLPSDMDGVRLACSMHLDVKMVPLVEGLLKRNASVFLTTCNPTTVRDDVVDYLAGEGAQADVHENMSSEEYRASMIRAIEWGPTHLCEMGASLTAALHESPDLRDHRTVQASIEATGSGINRIRSMIARGMPLRYPVYDWDDLPLKEGLHNRRMVGLTTWHAFFNVTQLTLHEKRVLIVGYGSVGRGLADIARSYGGAVTVAEVDPVRAIEARYAGYEVVSSLDDVLPSANVVVTATGAEGVISQAQVPLLIDGTFLLNAGHESKEIDVVSLQKYQHRTAMPFIEAIEIDKNRTVYLLAKGSMFNLTAGGGDSLNAFDVTLAVLVSGIAHAIKEGASTEPGMHMLPESVWSKVAK